jgi:nitrous oxide reductase accessory protein NosL
MGHIGATDGRITADNHGPQRRLVHQLNGQMGAPSPGQERTLHAFTAEASTSLALAATYVQDHGAAADWQQF